MKKYQMIIASLIMLLMVACKKEGVLISKPIKAGQPISFSGFAIGDTIEQYFDGRKVREFIGRSTYSGRIIFDSDAPVLMELKKKGSPVALFSKSIKQSAETTPKPITFYYDGTQLTERYNYPDAVAGIEQVAMYLDFPKDMAVDIVYGDASGDINAMQYLKRNVQPKQWVDFINIAPLEGSDLYVFLLKAGKKEFIFKDDFERSYLQINLPTTYGGYQGGGVQSVYVQLGTDTEGRGVLATQDLIGLFPR